MMTKEGKLAIVCFINNQCYITTRIFNYVTQI